MRPPTIDQLRNIADRADRGRLTAAEVSRLRQGLELLERPRRSPWMAWVNKIRALRRKLHGLHAPMLRGGIQICTGCSGWNGRRCLGLVTEWPCPTLEAFDGAFPAKEAT